MDFDILAKVAKDLTVLLAYGTQILKGELAGSSLEWGFIRLIDWVVYGFLFLHIVHFEGFFGVVVSDEV